MSGTLGALLAGVRDAPWASAAVSELRAVVADLADALAASLGAHADADACEAVVAALWQRAEQGAGWTEPFWRECYVLACVATAVALSSAPSGNHQLVAALRHLDLAFILGGPPECLLPFVAEVEPLVPRAGSIDARLLPRSLPEGDTPVLRAGLGLCRLESHEWARFRKEFFNVDAPVVLAGLGAAWPALDKWRDLEGAHLDGVRAARALLARQSAASEGAALALAAPRHVDVGFWNTQFGHRFVPLEVGKHTDGGWREEVVPMRDFLADLATGTRCLYLAQHPLFDHLTSLRADFEVPDCVGRRLTRINAWLGSSGTVTPLHYDSYDGACKSGSSLPPRAAAPLSLAPLRARFAHPGRGLQVRPTVPREQHAFPVPHNSLVGAAAALARCCSRGGRASRRRVAPGHHQPGRRGEP